MLMGISLLGFLSTDADFIISFYSFGIVTFQQAADRDLVEAMSDAIANESSKEEAESASAEE